MLAQLAVAVAAAPPGDLLPARRAGEERRLVVPLRLLDAYPLAGAAADAVNTVNPVNPVDLATADLGDGPWVAVVADQGGLLLGVPLVAARQQPLAVRRALPGDGAATALVDRLTGPAQLRVATGAFGLYPLDAGRLPSAGGAGGAGEAGLDVDQTHESVVVHGAGVVKWAVHLSSREGEPPAVRVLRHLAAVGFHETPPTVGHLVFRGAASRGGAAAELLLASVSGYLPGAQDGWDWYVDDLLENLAGRRTAAEVLAPARAIGGLVARLHLAMATSSPDNQQPVRAASMSDAWSWSDAAIATLDEALAVTGGDPGIRLAARAARARALLERIGTVSETPVTMVHGDLHVGQILRWSGGLVVNDFDGNPVLSAEQQSAMAPPARDVAGMVRSLDHVGRIADKRTGHGHPFEVDEWIAGAREEFLGAYRSELAAAGQSWLLDERLLRPFEVEQECRELVYAARHLPHWVYVPDAALSALLPEQS